MPDFHATILHLLGLDHEQLTYRHAGRDFRLTDVGGRLVKPILAWAVTGALAVGDGMIYGISGGDLCAFDATTGVSRWWDRLGTVTGSIAIGAHHLYATSGNAFLTDVSTANGTVKYNTYTHQPVHAAPALANGVLYTGGGAVSAYDTANGKLLWRAASDVINAAPTVSNGMLYVGSASQFTAYGLP